MSKAAYRKPKRPEVVIERLVQLGLRPSFATVYSPKNRNTCWIDCRPHGTIHSNRGKKFKSEKDAQRLADQLVERITGGERLVDVLAPYRPSLATVGREHPEQETWKEEYKHRMLVGAKRRAANKGIEFSISSEDLFVPSICPVLRIPLRPSDPGTGKNDNAPSLDRIIPSLGYVKGNVIVISWRANHLKRDATPEELKLVAEWLEYSAELPPKPIPG